ncbi:TIGR03546 family protein [Paraglaciecola aquimarina]|uniref:TIGR03546 family protein n=1 Tax=Paraglaciecola aquimarina TaxID=1235557 RepID=A0ABU3SVE0_9ALTE|nr:TIGR03546 family protein [Paraglaciecola aquimarina]MDU0353960.1 TIGR03546 family protein [Paraglaciecola aquimarina]
MGLLAKLLKALNSDASPWQLAFGFALGMIMGLTPFLGLHSLILLFIALFCRINISAFLVSWSIFSLIAVPLSSSFSAFGESMLLADGLQSIWTAFYNTYLGQLTQFYHTITLGSVIVALVLFPFCLLLSKRLVDKYRKSFMQWVNQLRIIQVIKGSGFYHIYQRLGE